MSKKANNKEGVFGIGDFEYKFQDELLSTFRIQNFFIRRITDLMPDVSDDLNHELFDLYQRIPEFYYNATKKRKVKWDDKLYINWYNTKRLNWKQIENQWFNKSKISDPLIFEFVEKMFFWSQKYHLNEIWCRERAYETLNLWSFDQAFREIRYWQHFPFLEGFPVLDITPHPLYVPSEFVFKYQGELLGKGFRDDLKKELISKFTKQLDDYFDACELEALNRGMKKTKRKYNLEHFDWLIDYQIKGKSFKEISAQDKNIETGQGEITFISDDTKKVRKAINELAELLNLSNLRPEGRRPGRPSKKTPK